MSNNLTQIYELTIPLWEILKHLQTRIKINNVTNPYLVLAPVAAQPELD